MRQLEMQAGLAGNAAAESTQPVASSAAAFQSKHILLVPVFRKSEFEAYFRAFEHIAAAFHWPEEVWAIFLQCKLVGEAQDACSSLSVDNKLIYEKVKSATLRANELVPKLYRQCFRGLKEAPGWTCVDSAREKGILFDRWCAVCKAVLCA